VTTTPHQAHDFLSTLGLMLPVTVEDVNQASSFRRHLSFVILLSIDSTWAAESTSPRLLRQPYLQNGTAHSMGVAWMIDDERSCSVHYGTTRELGRVAKSSEHRRRHFIEITGLDSDERYY